MPQAQQLQINFVLIL